MTSASITSTSTWRAHHVQLAQRVLDDLVVGGRGEDEERVGVLVGDDAHLVGGGARAAGKRNVAAAGAGVTVVVVVWRRRGWPNGALRISVGRAPGRERRRGGRACGARRRGRRSAARGSRPCRSSPGRRRSACRPACRRSGRCARSRSWPSRGTCGCVVTTSSAFMRSIGITRTMPASGLCAAGPKTLSRSCDQRLHVGAADREEAHRVAGEPVDVEEVDGVDEVLQLALVAGDDDEVAHLVDADRCCRRRRARAAAPSRARPRT